MIVKIVIGFIAGIISGLFASGGGLILVPAYVYIIKMSEEKARATSILSILPMVIISSIFYFKFDNIDWWLGLKCAIGGLVGGAIGAKLLKKISPKDIKANVYNIFSIFKLSDYYFLR
jgi:Predicted permeases